MCDKFGQTERGLCLVPLTEASFWDSPVEVGSVADATNTLTKGRQVQESGGTEHRELGASRHVLGLKVRKAAEFLDNTSLTQSGKIYTRVILCSEDGGLPLSHKISEGKSDILLISMQTLTQWLTQRRCRVDVRKVNE